MVSFRSYAARWRGRVPTAPLTAAYLGPGVAPALRAHRRIALGGRGPVRKLAVVPLQVWLEARWLAGQGQREVAAALAHAGPPYQRATGTPLAEQSRMLRSLARGKGITPWEAYDFDLLRAPGKWPLFIYDREFGWNLAVSAPSARTSIELLSDKFRTGRWLAGLGIPTPDSELVAPWQAAQAEDLAAEWIGRWGAAVGKPRWGSGGDGVFELLARPGGAGGFELRHYQRSDAAAEPSGYLRELLSSSDYVVQQRYESHAEFSECADRRRVVVMRVVTRDRGAGPEPFSCCVEIALPLLDGFARVAYVRVDRDGRMGGPAVPRWQGELEASGGDGGPVTSELQRILSAVAGLRVPDFERAVEYALRAHRALPGLFAAAWDIAITTEGAVVLEGNTGFGTRVPQWISGGLFAGLDSIGTPGRRNV